MRSSLASSLRISPETDLLAFSRTTLSIMLLWDLKHFFILRLSVFADSKCLMYWIRFEKLRRSLQIPPTLLVIILTHFFVRKRFCYTLWNFYFEFITIIWNRHKIFIFAAIKQFRPVDATTNPSLLLAATKLEIYKHFIKDSVDYAKSKSTYRENVNYF